MWRRNFSSRAHLLSGADAIVVSIPKSGRTWMRAFLCAYYCRKFDREMTLEPERYGVAGIPRIIYTHDSFEQRTKGSWWDHLRGKYLVPPGELTRARIVLLARDPRDAFVSLFIQLTRRTKETPNELKTKTISELLRDEAYGLRSMIEVMNDWVREFSSLHRFTLVRYEELRENTASRFRELLHSLRENSIDEAAFTHAMEFSNFSRMKKMEAAGTFDSKILRAGDVNDPESFKVRRGKVGGYMEYLSPKDQAYAVTEMKSLNPLFAYSNYD